MRKALTNARNSPRKARPDALHCVPGAVGAGVRLYSRAVAINKAITTLATLALLGCNRDECDDASPVVAMAQSLSDDQLSVIVSDIRTLAQKKPAVYGVEPGLAMPLHYDFLSIKSVKIFNERKAFVYLASCGIDNKVTLSVTYNNEGLPLVVLQWGEGLDDGSAQLWPRA